MSYSPNDPAAVTAEGLTSMTVSEIKALAAEKGYSITATKKADIIEQFLQQSEAVI